MTTTTISVPADARRPGGTVVNYTFRGKTRRYHVHGRHVTTEAAAVCNLPKGAKLVSVAYYGKAKLESRPRPVQIKLTAAQAREFGFMGRSK